MQTGDDLIVAHANLENALTELRDDRFFRQHKFHGTPKAGKCHQAHFRPYLSEMPWKDTDEPGTVFPCDSLVLNDKAAKFTDKYAICHALDVEKWLTAAIKMPFSPKADCTGCVFTGTVNMLDDWINGQCDKFDQHRGPMAHENFV